MKIKGSGSAKRMPLKQIPKSEQWLFKNKKALRSVLRGIRQAKKGKIKSLGSFAKFAKDKERK